MRFLTILGLLLATVTVTAQDVTAVAYQTVNVRSGPGTQFAIIGKLQVEAEVPVLAQNSASNRWLQISLPDSDAVGWIAAFTVTINGDVSSLPVAEAPTATPNAEPDMVTIQSYGRVNVRNGPSISYDAIGQLDIDDTALVLARSNTNNDWLYIENSGIAGWIAYFTVQVNNTHRLNTIPVRIPDTITGELVEPTLLLTTNYNVQLHSQPGFTTPVMGTIAFDTLVTPVGISPNGRWINIVYEGQAGWVWVQLLDVTAEQLAELPRRDPNAR